MKIPKAIRIGGVDYEVKETPSLNNGKDICYGHIDYTRAIIELNPDNCISPQYQGRVLWHEILHGIAEQANLELGDDEENIVDTLAKGIYQVLQDNARDLYDISDSPKVGAEDAKAG